MNCCLIYRLIRIILLLLKLRMFLLDRDVILLRWDLENRCTKVASLSINLLAQFGRFLDQVWYGLISARFAHWLHESLVRLSCVESIRAGGYISTGVPLDWTQESIGCSCTSRLYFFCARCHRIWDFLLHRHGYRSCDWPIDLKWCDRSGDLTWYERWGDHSTTWIIQHCVANVSDHLNGLSRRYLLR